MAPGACEGGAEMADETLFLLLHSEMVAGLYRAAEQGEGVSGDRASLKGAAGRGGGERGADALCLAGERALHHQAGEHGLPRRAGADREVSEAPACFPPCPPQPAGARSCPLPATHRGLGCRCVPPDSSLLPAPLFVHRVFHVFLS